MKIEKKRRVVITGLGTVNPTGNTVAESWAAVKAGRCAVGPITAFDTADFKVKLAAEVKDFDPNTRLDRREARKMARFTQFAVAAAEEALGEDGRVLLRPSGTEPVVRVMVEAVDPAAAQAHAEAIAAVVEACV